MPGASGAMLSLSSDEPTVAISQNGSTTARRHASLIENRLLDTYADHFIQEEASFSRGAQLMICVVTAV